MRQGSTTLQVLISNSFHYKRSNPTTAHLCHQSASLHFGGRSPSYHISLILSPRHISFFVNLVNIFNRRENCNLFTPLYILARIFSATPMCITITIIRIILLWIREKIPFWRFIYVHKTHSLTHNKLYKNNLRMQIT